MIMYVCGDSWTWDPYQYKNQTFYVVPWATILAKKLNLEIINDSMGCGGNSRILDCLENLHLQDKKIHFIILALTSHNRWHLPTANMGHWLLTPFTIMNDQTGNTDVNDNVKKWFVSAYDELDSVYQYYKIIWKLHELCKKFECPFKFFQAWDIDLEKFNLMHSQDNIKNFVTKRTNDPFIAEKYITAFNSLRTKSKEWNYIEKSFREVLSSDHYDNTDHPNQIGHELIAEHVYNNIGDQILNYLK